MIKLTTVHRYWTGGYTTKPSWFARAFKGEKSEVIPLAVHESTGEVWINEKMIMSMLKDYSCGLPHTFVRLEKDSFRVKESVEEIEELIRQLHGNKQKGFPDGY